MTPGRHGAELIRGERSNEAAATHAIHLAAFPTRAEARLVDALRAAGRLAVSRVAVIDGGLVGHVALSPVTAPGASDGLGLGPVAVVPAHQRRGIGSRLVADGLSEARRGGAGFVVVLGEPELYGRLGFTPAAEWGLVGEHGGGSAFQVLELRAGAVPRAGGLVRYAPEFSLVAGA